MYGEDCLTIRVSLAQKRQTIDNKQALHEDGERSIMYAMLFDRIYNTSISNRRGCHIIFLSNPNVLV